MERGANHAEDPHLPRTTGKAGENMLSARRLLRFPREYYTCSFIKMQPHASINYIAHIGLIQLPDKLVFTRTHPKKCCHCEPVRLSGVAIPLLRGKMY